MAESNKTIHNGVRNASALSLAERQHFVDSFDHVLTDCDGTVWNVDRPLPGTDSGVAALQRHGKRVVYVSNNASRDRLHYDQKLKESGFEGATFDADVLHPGTAAVEYLRQCRFDGLIYVIGTTVLRDHLKDSGFQVCSGSWDPIEESFEVLVQTICDDRPVRAVIIDWDFNLTMKQLHAAQMYLKNSECLFLVLATDMFLGFTVPLMGPGAFYRALEVASGRKAIVLGKPGTELRELILQKYAIKDPKRVLFVGDMLEQDIGFGKLCGFQTLAVCTGAIQEANIQAHPIVEQVPDYFLERFADFADVCSGLSYSK